MRVLALPFFFESLRGLEMLGLLFCLWMIFECVSRERRKGQMVLWLLLILFTPPVGPLVYFFIRVVGIRG